MDPSITDVASYLAAKLPTGAEDEAQAIQDWRGTLYNAKATRSLGVVQDMVERDAPGDWVARDALDLLKKD